MTVVVLLILVVVWAIVLGPSLLRRRAERHSGDSIGAFHRQLRVLGQTGPTLVDPANRLARMGEPGTAPGAHPPDVRHDPYFRPEACKRRREVLTVLLAATVGTGLLGAVPVLRPVLALTTLSVLALGSYVALLVRSRTLAVEREVKLRYLPRTAQPQPTLVVRRAAAR